MQIAFVLLLSLTATSTATNDATNPLAKTIQLLSDLEAKVIKEGEAEQKIYEDGTEWCEEVSRNTHYEIKTLKLKKEKLDATIAKCTTDSEDASAAIEKLVGEIATAEAELKDATAIREKEKADFVAAEAELLESIDALDRAIAILEREMSKNPALLQTVDTTNAQRLMQSISVIIDAASFALPDKQKLLGLIQSRTQTDQGEEDRADSDMQALGGGAPDPAAYKSHSSGIVDVLEDLKEKAEEDLGELRKTETTAQHNFDMLKQSLTDGIAADEKDKADEEAAKTEADETKAAAEGDLAVCVKDLAAAIKTLDSAHATCMKMASDMETSTNSRGEELKALATAKKILKETTGGAVAETYSMLQVAQSSQLKSRMDLAKVEVVTLIKKLAKQHHSAALAQLASKVSAVLRMGTAGGADPFEKVKGLIQTLIDRLIKEGQEEADEHAYCVSETQKTEAKLAELNEDIAKITSKIETAASKSAKAKAEVKELQARLAELAKTQAEMDNIRAEQHEDYTTAMKDLTLGLGGVKKALQVLRDYYGAAFLQQGVAHDKATGAGESIIGILEVVEADFEKGIAERESAEASQKEEYEKVTQENKVSKTMWDQDVKYKTQEFTELDKAIADMTGDKETLDSELAAVTEYSDKLKARCAPKKETYAERVARREAEIDGLKEALNILENETVFAQKSKRGLRGSSH